MERDRAGFTLIELLVVVAIIGMLVGLMVPAVMSARERARQGLCMNRLKELATATLHYESARGRFPGWRNQAPLDPNEHVSWVVALFPYLGREDLWRDWREGNGPVIYLEQLVCPSGSENDGAGALNYVANIGLRGENLPVPPYPVTPDILIDARWGIFHDRVAEDVSVTLDYISQYDGTSTTLMLSEVRIAARWDHVGSPLGFFWRGDYVEDGPDEDPPKNWWPPPVDATIREHVSSNHPGGVNACFADGHYRFLRDTIDYRVYQALMTPNGRGRIDDLGNHVEAGISNEDY